MKQSNWEERFDKKFKREMDYVSDLDFDIDKEIKSWIKTNFVAKEEVEKMKAFWTDQVKKSHGDFNKTQAINIESVLDDLLKRK